VTLGQQSADHPDTNSRYGIVTNPVTIPVDLFNFLFGFLFLIQGTYCALTVLLKASLQVMYFFL
jgi:hypothetical protein